MNCGTRCWGSLPADALAYIINDCGLGQSDVASIRLVCVHWRTTTNSHLKSLAPACTSLEQVASIAQRFPYLTNCDLTRCDTRLVGHASLCRDASTRLSTLLAALSKMPSLTSLHISDTFSERMGQKHWASLVCAQALVDVTQPVGPQTAPEVPIPPPPLSLNVDGAGTSGNSDGATAPATAATIAAATAGATTSATTAVNIGSVVNVATVLAAVSMGPTLGSVGIESSPLLEIVTPDKIGGGDGTSGGGSYIELPPALRSATDIAATATATTFMSAVGDGTEAVEGRNGAAAASDADEEKESGYGSAAHSVTVAMRDVSFPGVDLSPAGPHTAPWKTSTSTSISVAAQLWSGTKEEEAEAVHSDSGTADSKLSPSAPPPPPPPLVVDAAELSDPGIKSFARSIAQPGATHQHAFWLPDWCGRLAGLQELHIRGRQRPSSGLPPCLLWLHAGRTAPQLTSLSLVRLSLVTLPEQLQHLSALTRLVAQDCSLSLMPRGLAPGLPRLQYIDLSLNGLTALPPDFTHLTSLRHLDLQRNKLVSLPADIGRLSAVTCLLLNNNQLRQLPASLAALQNVEVLSCSYNWLGGMGPSLPLLCSLPRLRRLELACVSDVRCRLVPPQELRLLASHLLHLDLAANNLVPADVLGTLTSVRSLVLSDCGLLAVPPWVRRLAPSLHHLDLSNNSLSELPPWLAACTRLRHLSIAHNRLSLRVPPTVLEQMPQLDVVESE